MNNTFLDILHNALVSFLLPPCKFHNDVTTRFHTPSGKTSKSELKNYHVRHLLQYDIQIFLLQNISYLISDSIETIRLVQLIMASPSTISRRNPVNVDLVFWIDIHDWINESMLFTVHIILLRGKFIELDDISTKWVTYLSKKRSYIRSSWINTQTQRYIIQGSSKILQFRKSTSTTKNSFEQNLPRFILV